MVTFNSAALSSGAAPSLSAAQNTANPSMNAFAEQLAATLESYLSRSGTSSHLEIDIDSSPSQNSGARQFTVTVKTADNPAPAVAALVGNPTFRSLSAMQLSAGNSSVASDPPITNEVDAYWVEQPAEVQQLRHIDDPDQAMAKAQELASKGYAIDRMIMVHGWDPYQTMLTRQIYGYTWVPSIDQPSVELGPGVSFPVGKPYDPNNPPPGSIKVSTDFAKPFVTES
jgi:hypothetical protein